MTLNPQQRREALLSLTCSALQGILANPSWNAIAMQKHGLSDIEAIKAASSMAVMYACLTVGALRREVADEVADEEAANA